MQGDRDIDTSWRDRIHVAGTLNPKRSDLFEDENDDIA